MVSQSYRVFDITSYIIEVNYSNLNISSLEIYCKYATIITFSLNNKLMFKNQNQIDYNIITDD